MRSLRHLIESDPDCEALLECVDGCSELDRRIYATLLRAGRRLSIEQIAETVDRDRSTTYRAVRRLHDIGYLEREQVTYENGGYCYRYGPVDPEEVADSLRNRLADCHQRLDRLVEDFKETYGREVP